jgi:hypothetical protein
MTLFAARTASRRRGASAVIKPVPAGQAHGREDVEFPADAGQRAADVGQVLVYFFFRYAQYLGQLTGASFPFYQQVHHLSADGGHRSSSAGMTPDGFSAI